MPLPKGINDPAVRAAWLDERRIKLEAFDRLVGKGYSKQKAARAIGVTSGGVDAMRRSALLMEEGRAYGRGQGTNIDLGLALLSVIRRPGEPLSCADIAAWCDCSRSAIHSIEKRAVRKFRQRLLAGLQDRELAERLNELLLEDRAA